MNEIEAAATDVAAFVGTAATGPSNVPVTIRSFAQFAQTFGAEAVEGGLAPAVGDFFRNGGSRAVVVRVDPAQGDDLPAAVVVGMQTLEEPGLFNLLVVPPYGPAAPVTGDAYYTVVTPAAIALCERRRAMLLLDPPADWDDATKALEGIETAVGAPSANAAIYFPRLLKASPITGRMESFAPSGAVAGVIARTDAQRGVWRAPAGMDAGLEGVAGLTVDTDTRDNEQLNAVGINCLRAFRGKPVVWGARTRRGDARLADPWKYVPVRRTALFIEESLTTGTQWAVFEPNAEPLWASLRAGVESFLFALFRQGALQGAQPDKAYFVRCDRSTMTQADLDRGMVILLVGLALFRPGEFTVLRIQQLTKDTG